LIILTELGTEIGECSYQGKGYGRKSNSSYVEWIIKESLGFTSNVTHYVIVTRDDIIDIISSFPPQIKVI